MNSWRQLAIATYTAPKDSRIYGTYEVDVTSVLQYIKEKREAGIHLTITYFVAAAIARALYEDMPEVNCFIRRGQVVARENADVFFIGKCRRGGNDRFGIEKMPGTVRY